MVEEERPVVEVQKTAAAPATVEQVHPRALEQFPAPIGLQQKEMTCGEYSQVVKLVDTSGAAKVVEVLRECKAPVSQQ